MVTTVNVLKFLNTCCLPKQTRWTAQTKIWLLLPALKTNVLFENSMRKLLAILEHLLYNDIKWVSTREFLPHTTYSQTPPLNSHAGISSGDRHPILGLSLPLFPYFVYERRESSDENVLMRRLVWAFTAQWCINTKILCTGQNVYLIVCVRWKMWF